MQESIMPSTVDSYVVRQILGRIAVRGEDDGKRFTNTARTDAIAECLAGSAWRLFHDGSLAKIYAHREFDPAKPAVVVSSHIDMVARRCYANCEGEVWKGSFDNLITNAVVVACMLGNAFDSNVLVAFTGDEEKDLGGADEVAETLERRGIKVRFVVVTDVTCEGWDDGKAFTIENILPEEDKANQQRVATALREIVSGLDENSCIGPDEYQDEAWEYDEYDLPCCSVCIPCGGDDMSDCDYMHLEEGVEIRRAAIEKYAEALTAVVNAASGF
ncbi:MAG: hypothetical protein ILM98_01835 [Kiritimatiellae bacterium]|nr:hypothetical protein [Kiritimatiellia bacterium]